MPKGPNGQKRKADVIGNAVLVMKIWDISDIVKLIEDCEAK
jgi:hypothetical protein